MTHGGGVLGAERVTGPWGGGSTLEMAVFPVGTLRILFLAWQEAMLVALKSLRPACLFNIIGFGSTFKTVFTSSQIYNEVRRGQVWAWVGDGQW